MAGVYGFTLNIDGNSIKQLNEISKGVAVLEKQAKDTSSMFSSLLNFELLKQGIGYLKSAVGSTYDLGKSVEQTKMSFNVLLGSAEKGSQFFNDLKKFADFTPFTSSEAYEAGQMLLNYGVAAKDVLPYMQMLGDASAGNSEKFKRLTYAFSQVSAMGRLQGGDLRQMVEAGFNPLQEISEKTGESMGSLKNRMEKGGVSFKEMASAFEIATGAGGRFNGMMSKQSQTTEGLASTLQSYVEGLQVGIFDRFAPSLKEGIGLLSEWTQALTTAIAPKESEILMGDAANIDAMFELLKSSNLDIEQRSILIADMNSKYGDYLSNLVKESDTYAMLAENQKLSNEMLMQKIEQKAKEEVIQEYSGDVQQAQKDEIKARILQSKIKKGEDLNAGETGWLMAKTMSYGTTSASLLSEIIKEKERAKFELQNAISGISPQQANPMPYANLTRGIQGAKSILAPQPFQMVAPQPFQMVANQLSNKFDPILNSFAKKSIETFTPNKEESITDESLASTNLKEQAKTTSAKGGVGAAKVINFYQSAPIVQIKSDEIDSKSFLQDDKRIFSKLALIFEDIVTNQGSA